MKTFFVEKKNFNIKFRGGFICPDVPMMRGKKKEKK
jgi:hypothetical protein